MLKAVIFDMDGVIIDSEPIHYELNQKLFQSLKLEISDEEYRTYVGVTDVDMWTAIKHRHNREESVEALMARHTQHSRAHMQAIDLEPIPGIPELLSRIVTADLQLAIASSAPLDWIRVVVGKCNLETYFKILVSGEHVTHGKPAPDIFLLAAQKLGVEPPSCLVIEDSEKGVRAAKAAGMQCVGYRNPNSYQQDLSMADQIVDHLDDVRV